VDRQVAGDRSPRVVTVGYELLVRGSTT
jgi:hypothetical protein